MTVYIDTMSHGASSLPDASCDCIRLRLLKWEELGRITLHVYPYVHYKIDAHDGEPVEFGTQWMHNMYIWCLPWSVPAILGHEKCSNLGLTGKYRESISKNCSNSQFSQPKSNSMKLNIQTFSTYCSESTTKLKSVFTTKLDKISKSPGAGALVAPCFLAPWGETTSRSHQLRGDAAERRFSSGRFHFLGVMYGFIYRIFIDMWYMDLSNISYLGWLWNIMDNLGSRLGY